MAGDGAGGGYGRTGEADLAFGMAHAADEVAVSRADALFALSQNAHKPAKARAASWC